MPYGMVVSAFLDAPFVRSISMVLSLLCWGLVVTVLEMVDKSNLAAAVIMKLLFVFTTLGTISVWSGEAYGLDAS